MECNLCRENSHVFISIIIPVYNVEKYLNRCIESILNQSFADFQLILIDDGSTDSSATICDYYKSRDSRIQVFHQVNLGVSAARNKGLKHSRGDYVSFIDGDDWIDTNFYLELMKKLFIYPDIDIGVSGYKKDFPDGTSVKAFKHKDMQVLTNKDAINMMLERKYFCWELCDKIYKKNLFESCQFNEKLSNGEDFAMNYQLFSKARNILYYPLNAYHYYMRTDSMTHVLYDGEKTFLDAIDDVLLFGKFFEEKIKNKLLREYCRCCIKNIFQMFFWNESVYSKKIKRYQKRLTAYIHYVEEKNILPQSEYLLATICTSKYSDCKNYFAKEYNRFCDYLRRLADEYDKIYIYGAGIIGQHLYEIFLRENIKCSGFVISDGEPIPLLTMKISIFYLSQINSQERNFFILGLDSKNRKIVKEKLITNGCKNIYWPKFCEVF